MRENPEMQPQESADDVQRALSAAGSAGGTGNRRRHQRAEPRSGRRVAGANAPSAPIYLPFAIVFIASLTVSKS
jgi:hypothetical protein